ncbi:hypothetical protein M7I_7936 [Glarea lozoyensis 74030]|uniref:PLC-like phosphodiesterase n=1 Tax=Glarea lozoyensis (strain ATCC 74030 / MF5533) TaxID=1104152 RepID=H0EYN0_GLAL7|nr:hypothetical protein M7I_7936 [Glarea lozoyensis 74030]
MVFRQVPIALLFAIAANAQRQQNHQLRFSNIERVSNTHRQLSDNLDDHYERNFISYFHLCYRINSIQWLLYANHNFRIINNSWDRNTFGRKQLIYVRHILSIFFDYRFANIPFRSSKIFIYRHWFKKCNRKYISGCAANKHDTIYSNITEVAAHNSPFVKPGNAAANQALPVTTQLNDGIRLLQGQMHFVGDVPHFCHSSCDVLDAGPITDWLTEVREWVQSHPYDVVTILLGNGNYSLVDLYVPFIESTGILDYIYTPPKIPMGINDWPTLQNMIIRDEFSSVWETAFDPTNRSFPCDVQRPPGLNGEEIQNRMYLMNHNLNYDIDLLGVNLLVPYVPLLNVTNNVTGFGSLGVTTEQCATAYGYQPKFLNVDYYNVGKGSVFEVAARHNNVTYDRACCGLASTSAGMKTTTSSLFLAVAGAVGLVLVL